MPRYIHISSRFAQRIQHSKSLITARKHFYLYRHFSQNEYFSTNAALYAMYRAFGQPINELLFTVKQFSHSQFILAAIN
jgi:hypothetical protein